MLIHLAGIAAEAVRQAERRALKEGEATALVPATAEEAEEAVWNRLRKESYPDRAWYDSWIPWELHVLALARMVNRVLGEPLTDAALRRKAKRHAAWCWVTLTEFVRYRHEPELQARRGIKSGQVRRRKVEGRDRMIVEILRHFPGTTFRAIARALKLSASQVGRVVKRDAHDLWAAIRLRFRSVRSRKGKQMPRRRLRDWARHLLQAARPRKAPAKAARKAAAKADSLPAGAAPAQETVLQRKQRQRHQRELQEFRRICDGREAATS